MTPATFILNSKQQRAHAVAWIANAEVGSTVAVKPPTRTLPQNKRLHAMITDVARQVEWHGKKRDIDAWKDIFTAALRSANHDLDIVPGINGGFVLLGMHTSEMSVAECGELMELISAFGAERGVVFTEPFEAAA